MPDPWPDLDGEKPEEWDPLHWIAAQELHRGGSLRTAGEAVGRKQGTVSGWVTKWRARFGSDFLRNRPPGNLTDEGAQRGRTMAALLSQQKWTDVRYAVAGDSYRLGALTTEVAQKGLQLLLDDPARMALLEPRDLLYLARAAELALRRADHLLDIPDPHRQALENGRVPAGETDPRPPPGLLAELDGPASDRVQATQRDAEESTERFLRVVGDDPGPIEATSRKTG